MENILILGGLLVDKYFILDQYPHKGQDAIIKDTCDFVGGCSINMAMTIKNLGGNPYIVSCLANDEMGKSCKTYLEERSLPLDCIKIIEDESGYCLVFVDSDGERTFMTKNGCEGIFSEDMVPNEIMEKCRIVAITGYYLLPDKERKSYDRTALEYLIKLKDKGKTIIFDPSPLVAMINPEILEGVLKISDLIKPNWSEAEFLAGSKKPASWAVKLAKENKIVVITRGSEGGEVFSSQANFPFESLASNPIDSTGAGDSFTGALAYGFSKDWSINKTIRLARKCAALTTGFWGPHMSIDIDLSEFEA